MISWISSWAQGIIMAVIIGAIIEMILPEGNSKKYVKIVIGVYVLFTIISPVISKITGKTIQVSDILELNKYIEETENNSKLYVTLDEDNSNNIKDIYESSLRNDIKAKVAAKGYNAKNIKLEIEDDEEYTLKKIDIEIYKNMEKDKKDIETIQNVDINISQKSTENDMQEKLSEKDKRKLKDYLSGVYEIAEGKEQWKKMIREFYGPFEKELEKVEKELEHVELVEEVSDVKCEKCGRMMVYKYGRYGKFLACPGYPECKNAKPIVETIDVPCPKCAGKIQVRKTKRRRNYYICENNPKSCDYISWNKPKVGEKVEETENKSDEKKTKKKTKK